MRVFLFGTSHKFQFGVPYCSDREESEFIVALKKQCLEHNISILAEEMSPEGLSQKARQHSTCFRLAVQLNRKHKYCDPDNTARRNLGIESIQDLEILRAFDRISETEYINRKKQAFQRREAFWLEQLREFQGGQILFILGDEHMQSFGCLLQTSGIPFVATVHNWNAG